MEDIGKLEKSELGRNWKGNKLERIYGRNWEGKSYEQSKEGSYGWKRGMEYERTKETNILKKLGVE